VGGPRGAFTVKPLENVPEVLFVFKTYTFHVPVADPFKLNEPPLIVVPFRTENPIPVIATCPDFISWTVAPLKNPWPKIVPIPTEPLFVPLFGEMEETATLTDDELERGGVNARSVPT